MTRQLKCPACRQPLYFPAVEECDEDFLDSICSCCKYKYALIHTEVLSFASSVQVLRTSKYRKQPSYSRTYKLRLLKADGTIKSLEFSTLGQEERISALPEDEILLLYSMRGKALQNLVWIENYTTGESHLLQKPGAGARSAGFSAGALALVASGILASALNIPMNKFFVATAMPAAVGVGAYVTKRKSIKVSDRLELGRLASEQQLLAQKHELDQKIAELTQELKTNNRMIKRLETLQRKMIGADEDLYANRIETVAKGISVLEKQLDLTKNLINGYFKIVEIIDIEYETSRLAEQIPEDLTEKILRRLDELKAVEAKKEELALLVNPQKLLSYDEQG